MIEKISNEIIGSGSGSFGPFAGILSSLPVTAKSVTFTDGYQVVTDDGFGVLQGDCAPGGTINYTTGAFSFSFNRRVPNGNQVTANYTVSAYLLANRPLNWTIRTNLISPLERVEVKSNLTVNLQSLSSAAIAYNIEMADTIDGAWSVVSAGTLVKLGTREIIITKANLKAFVRVRLNDFDDSGLNVTFTQNTMDNFEDFVFQAPLIEPSALPVPALGTLKTISQSFGENVVAVGPGGFDRLFILDASGELAFTNEATEDAWIAGGNVPHTKVAGKRISFYNSGGANCFVVLNMRVADAQAYVTATLAAIVPAGGAITMDADQGGYYSFYLQSAGTSIQWACN